MKRYLPKLRIIGGRKPTPSSSNLESFTDNNSTSLGYSNYKKPAGFANLRLVDYREDREKTRQESAARMSILRFKRVKLSKAAGAEGRDYFRIEQIVDETERPKFTVLDQGGDSDYDGSEAEKGHGDGPEGMQLGGGQKGIERTGSKNASSEEKVAVPIVKGFALKKLIKQYGGVPENDISDTIDEMNIDYSKIKENKGADEIVAQFNEYVAKNPAYHPELAEEANLEKIANEKKTARDAMRDATTLLKTEDIPKGASIYLLKTLDDWMGVDEGDVVVSVNGSKRTVTKKYERENDFPQFDFDGEKNGEKFSESRKYPTEFKLSNIAYVIKPKDEKAEVKPEKKKLGWGKGVVLAGLFVAGSLIGYGLKPATKTIELKDTESIKIAAEYEAENKKLILDNKAGEKSILAIKGLYDRTKEEHAEALKARDEAHKKALDTKDSEYGKMVKDYDGRIAKLETAMASQKSRLEGLLAMAKPKVEPKPEPKVEPKPEPKIEPKPEPKVEPEPKEDPATKLLEEVVGEKPVARLNPLGDMEKDMLAGNHDAVIANAKKLGFSQNDLEKLDGPLLIYLSKLRDDLEGKKANEKVWEWNDFQKAKKAALGELNARLIAEGKTEKEAQEIVQKLESEYNIRSMLEISYSSLK